MRLMPAGHDRDPRLLGFARRMRRQPTDAERKVWALLRAGRLGVRFRRQHALLGYILDFYCPERRLAVELDGGQHSQPAHAAYDDARTADLERVGVRILRFWDNDVLKYPDAVAESIYRELQASDAQKTPHPGPLPGVPGRGRE